MKKMEMTWPIKLRIGLAMAAGIVIVGLLGRMLVMPAQPFAIISVVSGYISGTDKIILILLGFISGLTGYLLAWPMGKEIGVLAAPSGLAYLAMKSRDMGRLFQLNPAITARQEILSQMRAEPLFWLMVVAAGFFGVLTGTMIIQPAEISKNAQAEKTRKDALFFIKPVLAIFSSVVITQFFIGIFARDFSRTDAGASTAIAQPAAAQIALALLVSFGITGFLVKRILNLGYIPVIVSTCLINPFAVIFYGRQEVLSYFTSHWPAIFFPHATMAVLPVQMVAFGTIGVIAGYWICVRVDYWYKHGI